MCVRCLKRKCMPILLCFFFMTKRRRYERICWQFNKWTNKETKWCWQYLRKHLKHLVYRRIANRKTHINTRTWHSSTTIPRLLPQQYLYVKKTVNSDSLFHLFRFDRTRKIKIKTTTFFVVLRRTRKYFEAAKRKRERKKRNRDTIRLL